MARFNECRRLLNVARIRNICLSLATTLPLTATVALGHEAWSMPAPYVQSQGIHNHLVQNNFASASHQSVSNNQTRTLKSLLSAIHHNQMPAQGNPSRGVDLNLSSAQLNFLAGSLGNFSSLQIDVGGVSKTVDLNTKLTAAEALAVEQVIIGGSQTIQIGSRGTASGGTVVLTNGLLNSLDSSVGSSVASITIAKGVQATDTVGTIDVSGKFANYGSLVTAATTSGGTDTIAAGTIVNASGASIKSYAGSSTLFAADPILTAPAVTNNGTISSSGNVSINSPSVTNTGLISATNGNVNLSSSSALSFGGTGGTVQANNGNINMAAGNANITAVGGNWLSQQLNLNAGTGNIKASLGQVTGVINSTATAAHILASTPVLTIGDNTFTGDPTFVNTTGDIQLNGTSAIDTGGFPLAIVASGNIDIPASAPVSIITEGASVVLVAGATIKTTGNPANSGSVPPGSPLIGTQTVTASFSPSSTGGNVDLSTNNSNGGRHNRHLAGSRSRRKCHNRRLC